MVAERSAGEPSIAICSLIRNEADDLDEWIAFHWLQGIRKFILYDDGSTDNTAQVLNKYVQWGIVDYRIVNGTAEAAERNKNGSDVVFQMKYLNKCLEEAFTTREESKIDWVLFSDADEYLYPKALNMTTAQALDSIYRGEPCITMFRVDFGTSGHIDRPMQGLLIENYIHSATNVRNEPKKNIINLRPANATETIDRLGENPHTIDPDVKARGGRCVDDRVVNFKMNQYLRSVQDYNRKIKANFFSGLGKYTKDPLQQFWARELNRVRDDSAARGYAHDVRTLVSYWLNSKEWEDDASTRSLRERLHSSRIINPIEKPRGPSGNNGYPCPVSYNVTYKAQRKIHENPC